MAVCKFPPEFKLELSIFHSILRCKKGVWVTLSFDLISGSSFKSDMVVCGLIHCKITRVFVKKSNIFTNKCNIEFNITPLN